MIWKPRSWYVITPLITPPINPINPKCLYAHMHVCNLFESKMWHTQNSQSSRESLDIVLFECHLLESYIWVSIMAENGSVNSKCRL